MTHLTITETTSQVRPLPRWKSYPHGRGGYWTSTRRSYESKPRLYVGIEGETMLENFGYRASRPSRLYKAIMPEMLAALGLPADTQARWSQKAGCSCGCSPGFVLDIDQRFANEKRDYWVTVAASPEAQTTGTPEALAVAASRVEQLVAQV